VTERASGLRISVAFARRARCALEAGNSGEALQSWGHAGDRLAFTVGRWERAKISLAAVMLRKSLINLWTRLEQAVTERP
jgi:hypothetical protein